MDVNAAPNALILNPAWHETQIPKNRSASPHPGFWQHPTTSNHCPFVSSHNLVCDYHFTWINPK
jgi:hypothetical protein